jgi:hypothetical protein
MRLRLPFVYETRSLVRAGRLQHDKNVRAEIDVEIAEAPGLEDHVVFELRDYQIARWSNRLYARWLRGDEQYIQSKIDTGGRERRQVQSPELPIPPYMRRVRFGVVKNAFQAPAVLEAQVRIRDLPHDRECHIETWNARMRDMLAEQARAFYHRTLLASETALWVQCEEPVWQIDNARNDTLHRLGPVRLVEAYRANLVIAPDFRLAHRQFRLDRIDDAWVFAGEHRPVDDGGWRGPQGIVPERSDWLALAACVIEFLEKDGGLPDFFSEPRVSDQVFFNRADKLLKATTENDVPTKMASKLQLVRKRWEFERRCWERDELE